MEVPQLPIQITRVLLDLRQCILALPWVDRCILFGSFAKGTWSTESDVDLAVFTCRNSPCGLEEFRVLNRFCHGLDLDIQIQIFPAEELDDPCGIVEEIVLYGCDLSQLRE